MDIFKYEALGEMEKDLIRDVYLTLHAIMFRVAKKITGDHTDAEDAVSNAFIKIIRYISKIRQLDDERKTAYCIGIVKNEAINILRKRGQKVSLDEIKDNIDHSGFYIEEWLVQKQEFQILKQYIKELSAPERRLIHLRLEQDLMFQDIGILMDISAETAKKRYQRIVKKLRQRYERRAK